MKKRIVILGQGLAGTLLAFELIHRGHQVAIVDDEHQSSSSLVAAGMWNPVSFRNFNESWMATTLLKSMHEAYSDLEKKLSCRFYHPMKLARIFQSNEEANQWDERSTNPVMKNFLTDYGCEEVTSDFDHRNGHGVIEHAGWLDVPAFIFSSKKFFADEGILFKSISELNNYSENESMLIHCIGWKSIYSELFSWVPIVPNKGEVLTLKIPGLRLNAMVNFGRFIIPVGDEKVRLGATYKINEPDLSPTKTAEDELMSDFNHTCSYDSIQENHVTGFRPTTPDRKPMIGQHPQHHQHWIFNGFGSKGVMMIPFFANHLVDVIEDKAELMREVDVSRYWNKTALSYQSLVSNFKIDS